MVEIGAIHLDSSAPVDFGTPKKQLSPEELDDVCANAIRCFVPLLPESANSGHPGAPMGCAAIAHALYGHVMNYYPHDHKAFWNRDRFVLSNGHACALQYTMLHLCGYPISVDDMKAFRRLNSKCPGHPENFVTEGVEVTTGPLGQGIANAVGLAAGSAHLEARYNKPGFSLFDNYTFCIVGDGCLQEGISSEACSWAGSMGLGRLIVLYDSNGITIDGSTDLNFTEDVAARFRSYHWHVQEVKNAHSNVSGLLDALNKAKMETTKPSLIIAETIIGFGSQKQGTAKVHGAPIGNEEIKLVRSGSGLYGSGDVDLWKFPSVVTEYYNQKKETNINYYMKWKSLLNEYSKKYPTEFEELNKRFNNTLDIESIIKQMPKVTSQDKPTATRNVSEICLNICKNNIPELVGGSGDLTDSNKTALHGEIDFYKNQFNGRYFRFGVREHFMVAMCNGLCAYGGFRPFAATFFAFITYSWGALRVAALSNSGMLMISTHDSIELGEDGPTHQPVECLPLCRATPNMLTIRPADTNEVAGAYIAWLQNSTRPTVLCLCRSNVPMFDETSLHGTLRGAYILTDFKNNNLRKLILSGSGSDLQFAVSAARILEQEFDCRVVSFPCWELFEEQDAAYRNSVFPKGIKASYIEASSMFGWAKYFDPAISTGMTTFGASASAKVLLDHFGFTAEKYADKIRANY